MGHIGKEGVGETGEDKRADEANEMIGKCLMVKSNKLYIMETNEKYMDELEQMRHDMNELRSLLSEQQIVNERLMRRAMSKDMGKERSTLSLNSYYM